MSKSFHLIKSIQNILENFKFASTQYTLPKNMADRIYEIRNQIPKEFIDTNEDKNLTPHITVFHGLNKDDLSLVTDACKNFGSLEYTIDGTINTFQAKDDKPCKVLYLPVNSSCFKGLNKHISGWTDTSPPTYKDYKPHVTIAYVKKDSPEDYHVPFNSISGSTDTIEFCLPDGKHHSISLV